ncbi:MAG TPA: TonB-dependent receptor [Solimonas sp.]|nr:TonB-dependent receptor [Solimonas sp.]
MSVRLPQAARRHRTPLASLLILASLLAGPARADTDVAALPEDLTQLSLDELLKIEVTSVSKRAEPLQQAAAAVYVLTGEDIHRSGARSIVEALRHVPGLHVARSGQSYAVSARGFNSTSADKLEVLLDGRSVYTPLFSGVFWDALDTYLPDIERIEVIRGPGATLWGANAVNGVINIITRNARDTPGTEVGLGGGNRDHAYGGARQGWQLGNNAHARLYAQYRGNDNGARPDGSEPANGYVLRQTGFRADFAPAGRHRYSFSGDWYDGSSEGTSGDVDLSGGNLLARWEMQQSERAGLKLGVYFTDSDRRIPTTFSEQRQTVEVDLEQHLQLGTRHSLLFGLGYRSSRDDTGGPPLSLIFDPAERRLETYDGFIQDQIRLLDGRGTLTLGSKFEHNDFTGFEYQPSLRLGWNLHDNLFTWAAVSRAVRTPNRLDSDIAIFCPSPNGIPGVCGPGRFRLGNPELDAETLLAYEWGLRAWASQPVSAELALFYNDYDHLRSQEPAAPLFRFDNNLQARSVGGELNLSWRPRESLRLTGYYSYLQMEVQTRDGGSDTRTANTLENGNPRHMAGLELAWAPSTRWSFSGFLRHIDDLPASGVPGYTELNLRAAWRLRPNLELGLVGENLLDNQHPEFGSNTANRIEVQRQGLLQLRWWPQ